MEKYLFQVTDNQRKKKKAFLAFPRIGEVVAKAQAYGLSGNKLLLDKNGTEICDDEVLELFAKEREMFILTEDENNFVDHLPSTRPAAESEAEAEGNVVQIISLSEDSILESSQSSEVVFCSVISDCNTVIDKECAQTNTPNKLEFASPQFTIPWEKLQPDVMTLLQNKSCLGKQMNAFCNILVDELRKNSAYIPTAVIRNVAQQAADAYPDSFLERDRLGNIITSTPHSLISKMINRNNHLNRPPKKRTLENEATVPLKKRKIVNILKNSCVNWNPVQLTSNESQDVLVVKQKELQRLHLENIKPVENELISTYMKQCFSLQRSYFNNSDKIPNIGDIQKNWPYIFDKTILYEHFEMLMAINPKSFITEFHANKNRICSYFKKSKNKFLNNFGDTDGDVIKVMSQYFGEDANLIFKFFEFGTTVETVEANNPTASPWIAVIENSFSSSHSDKIGYIYIEKYQVASFNRFEFIELILQLICYYYTFNMMYPKEISLTMEFMFRFFFKSYSQHIRGRKKTINNISKVYNLITKLSKSC